MGFIAIVVGTILAVVLTRNPSGRIVDDQFLSMDNIYVFVVVTSTPALTIVQSATWTFDATTSDVYGTYNGTLSTNAAYSAVTYFGTGSSLLLNSGLNPPPFVTFASSYFNLSYRSFTVEAWVLLYTLTGDNVLFSQCECGSCSSRCLSLAIRNGKLYMAFSLNILLGNTAMSPNVWYHIAYVYDYSRRIQFVYLQGILDGTKTSSDPYKGQNGSIIIGASNMSSTTYNGLIDDIRLTTMAKSATTILTDATLVAYFSFDNSPVTDDTGPNKISATVQNAAMVAGKVNQALSFSGSLSYFQAYAFYQLSQANREFSLALWINPTIATGTIIQKTKLPTSTTAPCSILMAFSTIGQIIFGIPTALGTTSQIVGPTITVNQWTHLGYTYSPTNGVIMYINGIRQGTTGNVSYATWGTNYDYLNVAQNISTACSLSLITNGYYQGSIDEFYVYRRELTASAIASLANY